MKKVNGKIISTSLAVAMMLSMPGSSAMAAEFQTGENGTVNEFSDTENSVDTQSMPEQNEIPSVEDSDAQAAQAVDISGATVYFNDSTDRSTTYGSEIKITVKKATVFGLSTKLLEAGKDYNCYINGKLDNYCI